LNCTYNLYLFTKKMIMIEVELEWMQIFNVSESFSFPIQPFLFHATNRGNLFIFDYYDQTGFYFTVQTRKKRCIYQPKKNYQKTKQKETIWGLWCETIWDRVLFFGEFVRQRVKYSMLIIKKLYLIILLCYFYKINYHIVF